MVDVENLTKSFGDLEVLRGINMHVDRGEVVSIVGASGAGKTTLLQIIGTLDRPTSGTVRIGGTDTSTLGEDALARFRNRHIGFVFQFHQLLPEFTARENVMIPALIGGTGTHEAGRHADELLGFLGMTLGCQFAQLLSTGVIQFLHLVKDAEGVFGVSTQIHHGVLVGIAAQRCAVGLAVLLVGCVVGGACALAHHAMSDDEGGLAHYGLCLVEGAAYLGDVVAVDGDHLPSHGCIFSCGVLAHDY